MKCKVNPIYVRQCRKPCSIRISNSRLKACGSNNEGFVNAGNPTKKSIYRSLTKFLFHLEYVPAAFDPLCSLESYMIGS